MSSHLSPRDSEEGNQSRHDPLRLEMVLRCARMGTCDWMVTRQTVNWDRQMHFLFGIEPGTFGGRFEDFLNLLHPADRERVTGEMAAAVENCQEFDGEFRVVWPSDGTTRVLRMRSNPSCVENGCVTETVGVAWDITERKLIEDDLTRKRYLLEAMMEHIPDKIYFKDLQSRFICVNRAKLEKHGLSQQREILGKTDFDFFPEERARRAFEDEQRTVRTGEPMVDQEEKDVWPDGRETWVSTTKLPLTDSEGRIIGTFGLSRDISERKRAEAELAEFARELRTKNEVLEDDMNMARELQSAMLPQRYPHFSGAFGSTESVLRFHHLYRPSMAVSGDFFEVVKISETKAGVFICDVMGHGARAAMIAAMLHSLIGELHSELEDPSELLAHLNRALRDTLKSSSTQMFATAFYVVVDLNCGELRYANAGHPRPLLLRPGEDSALPAQLDGTRPGPALGLIDNAHYVSNCRSFLPNDVLLLFTDGLFEIDGPGDQLYDYEQLQRTIGKLGKLPTEDLCRSLVEELQKFSASREFADDVCLVAMEVGQLVPS